MLEKEYVAYEYGEKGVTYHGKKYPLLKNYHPNLINNGGEILFLNSRSYLIIPKEKSQLVKENRDLFGNRLIDRFMKWIYSISRDINISDLRPKIGENIIARGRKEEILENLINLN